MSGESVGQTFLSATVAESPKTRRFLVAGGRRTPLTVIEPRSGWQFIGLRELWRYREVLYYLTWRDLKVRYKQTVLGVGWALLQPLAAMVVFALFLGRLGGVGSGIENYALFVFAGILPWTFFANALTTAGNSVVVNERLVTKVYFPRLLVPISSVAAALFDFVVALVLLGVLMACHGVVPSWQILLAPALDFPRAGAGSGSGFGTLLAALIVAQRDFRYILAFGVQLWMFATPAIYLPPQTFGPLAQTWLPLNPAYGLILNFRQAVLGRSGRLVRHGRLHGGCAGIAGCRSGVFPQGGAVVCGHYLRRPSEKQRMFCCLFEHAGPGKLKK